jgi:hypothetical protein
VSERRQQLAWFRAELNRALQQLESPDNQEVAAALQMLWMIQDRDYRLRALQRIDALRASTDRRIAAQADRVFQTITSDLAGDVHQISSAHD